MPRRAKKPLEHKLENWAKKEAKKRGILFWKLKFIGNAGAPDRIVIANGRVVFIEFKRGPKHKPSPHQKEMLTLLRSKGFNCYVVYTQHQVEEIFKALYT